MKFSIGKWSINQKLAFIVGGFGFFAVFAGSPYKGSELKIDSNELGMIVEKEVDHVSPQELAGWIVQGKSDYRLLDLRSEKDFNEYHIPSAENVSLTSIRDAQLSRNEKVILYSDGGIHSAQAWLLLKANSYKGVYILKGGLEEWKDSILFPRLADNATPGEVAAFEKTKEISKFFGGSPQVGGSALSTTPKLAMPKLEAPSAGQPKAATGKKKKEGC